ncbi:hypothetical protein GGI12_000090 [Dipsacomyces acuminosporus]|nr:hypothetical protein GGI12_000090 [Dipsacomyces acuminosporus]
MEAQVMMDDNNDVVDFDFDSSGSLSSLESVSSDFPDTCSDNGDADPPAPIVPPPAPPPAATASPPKRKRGRPRKQANLSPANPPTAKVKSKRSRVALSTKSPLIEKSITTTGAFFTRATLRQLGIVGDVADPETVGSSAVAVGSRAKVLSLDKKWYRAVILAINEGRVLIHYPDWDHSYNEWIQIDSRRLKYKSKSVLAHGGIEDSGMACSSEDSCAELDFDIQKAVQEALKSEADYCSDSPMQPCLAKEEESSKPAEPAAAVDPKPTHKQSRPRGRPPGSKSCKKSGQVKKQPKPTAKASATSKATAEAAADQDDVKEEDIPQMPKEFRIPSVRMIRSSENPYAKFPRAEDVLDSGSDSGCDSKENNSSSNSKHAPAAKTKQRTSSSQSNDKNSGHTASNDDTANSNSIWHLSRGPYVTTGAFLTRRTIKCLAQNESSGGIMQDHHGYYPGQLVEVMNANHTWYIGRVISYVDKKFLVHYIDWGHSHNEWVAAGSKRMRRLADRQNGIEEAEEEARKICAALVDGYNVYVEEMERKKEEQEKAKQKKKPQRRVPVNERINDLTSKALSSSCELQNQATETADSDEMLEIQSDVEPISVEHGYSPIPQLLHVKDYAKIYHKGMQVAARDRDKQWWKAEIAEIKAFRIRVHYAGFPSKWDEWMEMNTQRIMSADKSTEDPTDTLADCAENRQENDSTGSGNNGPGGTSTCADAHTHSLSASAPAANAQKPANPPKRRGRPPKNPGLPPKPPRRQQNADMQSVPLSLRLALKASMKDHEMYEQCHPEDAGVFHLPKEHMTVKDYMVFLQIGDKVRVRDRDKQWYSCTIIDAKHGRIRVCFDGHSEEYNQWIAFNSDRIRILRETIESDRRLEKLEYEAQVALRRKQEKARAKKRQQSQAAIASLEKLAGTLEYIVDHRQQRGQQQRRARNSDAVGSSDSEDIPLMQQMIQQGSGPADSMPLLARMLLPKYLSSYYADSASASSSCLRADSDSATWFVYCNQCNIVIHTFRYYCTACEKPSDGYDYESFDLCLMCFSRQFPYEHAHHRSSFARKAIGDVDSIVKFTSNTLKSLRGKEQQSLSGPTQMADLLAGLVVAYEPDSFDTSYEPGAHKNSLWSKLAIGLHGTTTATNSQTKSAVVGPIARFSNRSHLISSISSADPVETLGGGGSSCSTKQGRQVTESIPRCAFCGDEDPNEEVLGGFVENRPFILTSTSEDGAIKRRRFWVHSACAKYSPEVLVSEGGQWYNVAAALKRARTIKCAGCKQRGATIGCFYDRCQKSYHVACTGKPTSFFESGYIFWCRKHSRDDAHESGGEERASKSKSSNDLAGPEPFTPSCAICSHRLTSDLMWMVCLECPSEPSQQFNVCLTCYETKGVLTDHPHKKRCFREHLSNTGGVTSTGQYMSEQGKAASTSLVRKSSCHYCRCTQSRRWRKGYGGVVMCEPCFEAAHTLDSAGLKRNRELAAICEQDIIADDGDDSSQMEVVALNPFGANASAIPDKQHSALVEDYTQSAYFTRETCVASNRVGTQSVGQQPLGQLSSYGPTDSMLFTLIVDSTYFDIPGRAPRWGSHSGTDYHGTWLPQTVRRALLRYTTRGDRVLSNFLGRGTDAIECFLQSRKCIGVDINPSAVALSQRNCSFTILPDSDMSVEYRPVIMQGDARSLCSGSWPGAPYFSESESYDHILSHPPYKDCVIYSTNIDGDLSRFPGPQEFQKEMGRVIADSWQLLKTGRYLTLGIGDNRAECFYIPVSYQLIRNYIDCGFELDELIVKRQRYCQAFGLGMYLCVHFDFLMFTHEFIATLRKVPKDQIDKMHLTAEQYKEHKRLGFHRAAHEEDGSSSGNPQSNATNPNDKYQAVIRARTLRAVPASPIDRNSIVMGSVWTFEPHAVHSFPYLCMSRMVERFGRDNSNWEHINLEMAHPANKLADCKVRSGGRVVDSDLQVDSNTAMSEDVGHDGQSSDSDSEQAVSDNGDDDDDDGDDDDDDDDDDNDDGNGDDVNLKSMSAIDYEKERQKQIQRNREALLQLGLVSELGEDSTDIAHYRKMIALPPKQPISETPLALVVVPHIPETQFLRGHIEAYRQALVQITHDVSRRLSPSGLLAIGVQDVRDENGKLWPLGMLVLEDVERAVGDIRLRLKEFIVVVEQGHARKRDDVVSRERFVDEQCIIGNSGVDVHLPIVHAYYLVFMKLR